MKKQSAKINYPKSTKNKKVLITMLIDAENEPMLIETIEKSVTNTIKMDLENLYK